MSMSIGTRIRELRKKNHLTQLDLSNLLYVTDKAVSSWESDRTEPSLETLIQLSEVLECSVSYLLYGNIEKLDIETEVKIKLTEQEFRHLDLLLKKEADYLKEIRHVDTYYSPKYNSFLNQDKIVDWLRIGERGGKKILNYKHWYDVHCDEYEVEINDSTNLDKIFNALQLEKVAIVDKIRKTYFYQNKYEFALDKVKDLGYFVEIEIKNYQFSVMEEYDALLKVAKSFQLNLDHIDRKGYPYDLIEKAS